MTTKVDVRNVDLRQTQEKVGDSVKRMQNLSRKTFLAYAGLWGMAYDEAKELVDRGKELVDKAENRGEKIEKRTSQEAKKYYEQAETRLNKVQTRVRKRFETSESTAEQELETQVERVLERLGIPSRERIVRLSSEIEALSQKIDRVMAEEASGPAAEAPMPGYDEMTAKEVVSHLRGLTLTELAAIRTYELAHENRVTVLREIDRQIEAMPIAGYDELTVEEIEPVLETLDSEQLQYVATYEKAHENRVTLLEAIDRTLAKRKETSV